MEDISEKSMEDFAEKQNYDSWHHVSSQASSSSQSSTTTDDSTYSCSSYNRKHGFVDDSKYRYYH